MQTADLEAHCRRDGETIVSNMCHGCIGHAQAEGWRVNAYGSTIEPCDWCNEFTSVPDFQPPYVIPAEVEQAPAENVVCDMADYFTPLSHRFCGAC